MGRLRSLRNFGERADSSQSKEPAKVFIIATEGETEVLYFKGFDQNAKQLKIKDKVIVEVLEKEDTMSAPKHVKALLDEYKIEYGVESEELCVFTDFRKSSTGYG